MGSLKITRKGLEIFLPFYSPPLLRKFLQLGLSHHSCVNHSLDLLWVEEEMRKGEMGERCCVRRGEKWRKENKGREMKGVCVKRGGEGRKGKGEKKRREVWRVSEGEKKRKRSQKKKEKKKKRR
jgi:hypothetical protein